MASSSSPSNPVPAENSLPGRIICRTGVYSQIPGAALKLGEIAFTTDNYWGHFGDGSQKPAAWPTNKTVGDFDWTNLNPFFKNINVETINDKDLSTLFNEYITTGPTPVITIINDNLVKTVYGTNPDFADLGAAYAWLSQRTISTLGSVTLVFPAAKILDTKSYDINHPNGDRITWQGANLKQPIPNYNSFQVTGNSPGAQALDNQANLALLRQSFATELAFSQGGTLNFSGNIGLMKNILITSDGDLAGKPQTIGMVIDGAKVNAQDVAVYGFEYLGALVGNTGSLNVVNNGNFIVFGNGGGGIGVATSSVLSTTSGNVISISNGARHANDFLSSGIQINDNSLLASYPYLGQTFRPYVYSAGNYGYGLTANSSVIAGTMSIVSSQNKSHGVLAASGSRVRVDNMNIINNGGDGIQANNFSSFNTYNSNISGNIGIGVSAYNYSFINCNGSGVSNNGSSYSPTINNTGNNASLVV